MLSELYIQNYALIDQIELRFGEGLNIITGETGAGKSIILGALGLILGNRADTSILYQKDKKCIVEGRLNISAYDLQSFFDEHELDYDDELVIRREIIPTGKSRAFVNDTPAKLSTIKELCTKLIDLHLQFDTLEIREPEYQLSILDLTAGNKQRLAKYRKRFQTFNQDHKKLEKWILKQKDSNKEKEYLQYQFDELQKATLISGEQNKLEQELDKITNLDSIKKTLTGAMQVLENDEMGLVSILRNQLRQFDSIRSLDQILEDVYQRMEESTEDMIDLLAEIEKIYQKYEDIHGNIDEVQERLDLIYSLQQKHKANSEKELIDIQADMERRIQNMDSQEEEIHKLASQLEKDKDALEKSAIELRKSRKKAKSEVESFVVDKLRQMGISNASLEIHMQELKGLSKTGLDFIEYYFAANKGGDLLPIKKVASGGEISRLNLAFKSLIANETDLPTLIFDEIDSGISGEIALRLGNILSALAKRHQIISITHSPQVAARADLHFSVYKQELKNKTYTYIESLTPEARVIEVAKMLSGDPPIPAAIHNAKELISGH